MPRHLTLVLQIVFTLRDLNLYIVYVTYKFAFQEVSSLSVGKITCDQKLSRAEHLGICKRATAADIGGDIKTVQELHIDRCARLFVWIMLDKHPGRSVATVRPTFVAAMVAIGQALAGARVGVGRVMAIGAGWHVCWIGPWTPLCWRGGGWVT